jgi:Tol biopolymer transport system component
MGKRMQMLLRQVRLSLLTAGSVFAWASCGGEDIVAPTSGTLEITTATSGPEPDADGYVVTVDDRAPTVIGANATLQLQNVEAGNHAVQLAGIAETCAVAGENPRSIQVEAGKTVALVFTITCAAPDGAIRVSVTTSGSPADPDGYVAKLDGGEPGLPIEINGNVTFTGVPAGSHTVALAGAAADCAVTGGPTQAVTVAPGETSELAFEVTCALPAASIEVTTVTTGSSPDPDGYTVTVDVGTPQAIASNATLALEGLAVGTHSIALSGIAGNCHLDGDNPRTVEVQGRTTVTFVLTCLGPDALIAFSSNASGLLAVLVVSPDGTGLRNLTPDGEFESDPIWSPDGRRILFLRDGSLYLMNGDGSGRVKLANGLGISEHRWSADGRMIAYVDARLEGHDLLNDLWAIHSDGTGKIRVAENAFNFSWSPDGRLVYTSDADLADVHFRIINADGTGEGRLTTSQAGFQPAWSPDGTRIAFVGLDGKDLLLINPDGTGEMNLTQGLSENDAPAWSPDGSRIAFGTSEVGAADMEIAVINRDGGGQTLLTHPPGFDFQPAWSPDGTKIVFTRSELGGDSEIHVMNADGSNQINVSNRPETAETGPDWNGQGPAVTAASRQSAFYNRWLRANRLEADRGH